MADITSEIMNVVDKVTDLLRGLEPDIEDIYEAVEENSRFDRFDICEIPMTEFFTICAEVAGNLGYDGYAEIIKADAEDNWLQNYGEDD